MKPLIEVCVGRHSCYGKEIPWHWDDGTNGLLPPLSGMTLPWLVVEPYPSEKYNESSVGIMYMENKIHVPNHQTVTL